MVPIICIVGASDSGKTTLLEKLIPIVRDRGYRVGTIKHDAHGFEMDREGKDTWRHRRAGAQTIAISSPAQVACIRVTTAELPLDELAARYFWQEDIILTEGYKRSHYPKIEVFRSAVEPQPICRPEDNLIAVITDDAIDLDVPSFRFDEVSGLADFIEERYLKERKRQRILVSLDGKKLPIKDFVQDFLIGGIVGMLSTLRGWKNTRGIDIHITLEER
ncbi:MAG: molybdopterin-guanine dinucleotide biosynthesis protein B [Desulforhabdus sp.]|jgi:molybdopterin-guanine dinucleotide biosynthesis protein B|nr:molybdopterin-guanine dinucleotide biosynthesis protein B [Desulforhabdus sp.]